jgi:hypothetical protein
MRFELEPYRRNVPDETFLEDLRFVAQKLGKSSVTMAEYAMHGTYHSSSVARRFGSWFVALAKAGLSKSRSDINVPLETCVADLKRVAQQLGNDAITHEEYAEHGQFSPKPLIRHYGSWQAALEMNGLRRSRNFRVSEEEYFENLELLWRTLGRQPRYGEVRKPFSKLSAGAYEHKFGSWRKALEAFVEFVNKAQVEIGAPEQEDGEQLPIYESSASISNLSPGIDGKTSRTISWRLRHLVMRRDNFKCCHCGRSPALVPGVVLHIDHKEPWSKGGKTTLDNLQTLCNRCNIGKSNLSQDHQDEG